MLAMPFIAVLFIVTFFDAAIHQCYFVWTGRYLTSIGIPGNWVMPVMSIGQIAEIGTMAILGYFLKSLGWKRTMIIGILGHAVRFGVFAFIPIAPVAVAINVLHGVCYAFFFATVYIFVDEFFPKDARSSAQGLFNLLILGVGPLVGNFLGPYLIDYYTDKAGVVDFRSLFLWPTFTALFAATLLLLCFKPPAKEPVPEPVPLSASEL